jgi:NADH-quinone oxidoreductase subunit M
MSVGPTLLLVLLGLPLAAAVAVALLGRGRAEAARVIALFVVLINLGLTVALVANAAPKLAARELPADGRPLSFAPIMVPGAVSKDPASEDSHRTKWELIPLDFTPQKPGVPRPTNAPAVRFYLGVDGINLWLVALTSLLMVSAVLASWEAITERAHEYYAWLLVLATGMTGVFLAFDIILFYVFFELTLIPLYFLVGVWGGSGRREAARKLFLYTLAGSLITLIGALVVVGATASEKKPATFEIPELVRRVHDMSREAHGTLAAAEQKQRLEAPPPRDIDDPDAPPPPGSDIAQQSRQRYHDLMTLQAFVFLTLCVGFAVKVPLVPVHTWLPDAYAEAPLPITFLLSAVLAKMGTYGILRLAIPLAPDAALSLGLPVLGSLGVLGIVYGAFCAFGQTDLRRLLAYSSVSHLGFCVLGLVTVTVAGLTGGLLHMVNHGLATGLLFLLIGMLADRYGGNREGPAFSGLAAKFPTMALLVMLGSLASVGLPGLNSFVSEVLMLAGVVASDARPGDGRGWTLAVGAAAGIVLGAWYTMTMLRNVFFGPLREPGGGGPRPDLNGRELVAALPLAVFCVVLGLFPTPVLKSVERDIAVVATPAAAQPPAVAKTPVP